MAPSLRIAGIALVSLSISAGVYGLFGLGFAGGLMKILQAVIGDSNSSWPGTTSPFRRTFTGVSPIDAWLTNLNPFFAHLADGSDANLSLFWLFMFGQYGVAWALVLMESLRVGNAGKIVSYAGTFGILMQTAGFAIIFPTYLLVHLLTSPIARLSHAQNSGSALRIASSSLAVIPFSITAGYIIPSIEMSLPSPGIVSISKRQLLISCWQAFPLHTITVQYIFSNLHALIFSPRIDSKSTTSQKESPSTTYLAQASRAYKFLLALAATSHISALLLTLLPHQVLRSLLPSVEAYITSSNVTFSSVYIPPAPLLSWRAANLADGVHTFLFWDTYVSWFAAAVWSIVLLSAGGGSNTKHAGASTKGAYQISSVALFVKAVFWTLLAGPFGGIVILLWERDAVALSGAKQHI